MPRQTVKMAEATTLNVSTIHEILPTEIFVDILKRLDFKSITNAKGACKEWKKIIVHNLTLFINEQFWPVTLKLKNFGFVEIPCNNMYIRVENGLLH